MNYEFKKPIVLISAERPNITEVGNYKRTLDLRQDLINGDFGFKVVNGHYKGRSEISYAVVCLNNEALEELISLSDKYGQDCILYRDENDNARLESLTGTEYLGKMVQATEYTATESDNYTYDPTTGGYYVVRP